MYACREILGPSLLEYGPIWFCMNRKDCITQVWDSPCSCVFQLECDISPALCFSRILNNLIFSITFLNWMMWHILIGSLTYLWVLGCWWSKPVSLFFWYFDEIVHSPVIMQLMRNPWGPCGSSCVVMNWAEHRTTSYLLGAWGGITLLCPLSVIEQSCTVSLE